ncbi:hypothetical protein Hypma_011162 [Hypsizygus marmoreus]|uniref:Uncharacterized protein n=1 Tax=Hypsizygus marmoreus TaxID=39966 RepID=A0A369JTL6_HYPMA|nr:hypothetical protein Hypma_011162 [Hypsizygus marmoreus]
MPAPQTSLRSHDVRPALGHVNLMVDTFIANANVDDLRSIVRSLLSTNSPNLAMAFTTAARSRLRQTNAKVALNPYSLFIPQSQVTPAMPTQNLRDILTRARALYGAGLGFASLGVLAMVVRASIGLRWDDDGDMADLLAVIDADIGQAIQSSKEEIEGGRVENFASAREVVDDLRAAVKESQSDVKGWGGEFPFERAASSLEFWKI